jgi:hypothetical protein
VFTELGAISCGGGNIGPLLALFRPNTPQYRVVPPAHALSEQKSSGLCLNRAGASREAPLSPRPEPSSAYVCSRCAPECQMIVALIYWTPVARYVVNILDMRGWPYATSVAVH